MSFRYAVDDGDNELGNTILYTHTQINGAHIESNMDAITHSNLYKICTICSSIDFNLKSYSSTLHASDDRRTTKCISLHKYIFTLWISTHTLTSYRMSLEQRKRKVIDCVRLIAFPTIPRKTNRRLCASMCCESDCISCISIIIECKININLTSITVRNILIGVACKSKSQINGWIDDSAKVQF